MEPVSNVMEKISVAQARRGESVGREVRLAGWVRTRRDSKGGFSFLELNDGSSFGNVQIVAEAGLANYESEIKKLGAGSSVTVEGLVKASPAKGQETEVHAGRVIVHGLADPDSYPLQKKQHSFEFLRTIAHLRPRTNTFGAIARVRNCVSRSIHEFFGERGFLYVHTPIITASDCEGAGEMFKVTTLDLANVPKQDGKIDYSKDFFNRPAYLTVSGQLQGEIFACALGKIYTFGPTFRAEKSKTRRHLTEFWMVEPEVAFNDLDDDMDLAEEFLEHIVTSVLKNRMPELKTLERNTKFLENVKRPLPRITYDEAVDILHKKGIAFEWGNDLGGTDETTISEQFDRPVMVHRYPSIVKAFYMKRDPKNDKLALAVDVLAPEGYGEIIGGSQREDDYDTLVARLKEHNLPQAAFEWYLDLRRYGSVPHAGFGLGVERTVSWICGLDHVRETIPFARMIYRLTP